MWTCAQCGYINEDFDEDCLKCGSSREETGAAREEANQAGNAAAETMADATQPIAPIPAPSVAAVTAAAPKRKSSPVLAIIIAVAAIGIIAAILLAYQRGMLPGLEKAISSLGQPPAPSSQALAPAGYDYPEVSPSIRRSFQKYEKVLDTTYTGLSGRAFTLNDDGSLSAESIELLGILNDLGGYLAKEYTEFESAQAKVQDEAFKPYAEALRERFIGAMVELLGVVGQAYALDYRNTHAAYLLPDTLAAKVNEAGHADGTVLLETWEHAAHMRAQHELDDQYASYYAELQTRLDELNTVHHAFNEKLGSMPPYTIRAGHLGKDARELLDIYDLLAFEIERMALGFEEYQQTLAGLERSDRMDELTSQFESLAKTDHLYCFTETYIIYAQDKQLDHPAYTNLEAHFNFVEQHWPYSAGEYRQVYMEYEAKWDLNWRGK